MISRFNACKMQNLLRTGLCFFMVGDAGFAVGGKRYFFTDYKPIPTNGKTGRIELFTGIHIWVDKSINGALEVNATL